MGAPSRALLRCAPGEGEAACAEEDPIWPAEQNGCLEVPPSGGTGECSARRGLAVASPRGGEEGSTHPEVALPSWTRTSAPALLLGAVVGLSVVAVIAAGHRGASLYWPKRSQSVAKIHDTPLERDRFISEVENSACAAPEEGRCFEAGHPDHDCCAMVGQGHCEEGFAYIEGEVCYKNGARRTCCMAPRKAAEDQCAYPEEQKCKENGHPDNDCCALPGHGSCEDGYTFSKGKVCFKAFGAVTTCCKKGADLTAPGPPPEDTCAEGGANCQHSQCCKDAGSQCYRKNLNYAGCLAVCPAGWNCEALGPRTPDDSTEGGSWPGENCGWTKRCNMEGMTCFKKDDYFATCKANCSKGEHDSFDKEAWDCERLGAFEATTALASAPAGERTAGLSLFCVLVVSTANTATTHEDILLNYQRTHGLGIFACEASAVHWAPKAPRGSWQSVANVGIFVDIWNKIRDTGDYKHHDWVVKADPDTVWFPDRLKRHLSAMRVPAKSSVYLQNCDFKFKFQGSFEVVSSKALEKYLDAQALCVKYIGTSGGEDAFFKTCMTALGIDHMKDVSLLNDKYTWESDYDMNDVSFCGDSWKAAFHPLKTPELWQACKQAADTAVPEEGLKRLRK